MPFRRWFSPVPIKLRFMDNDDPKQDVKVTLFDGMDVLFEQSDGYGRRIPTLFVSHREGVVYMTVLQLTSERRDEDMKTLEKRRARARELAPDMKELP